MDAATTLILYASLAATILGPVVLAGIGLARGGARSVTRPDGLMRLLGSAILSALAFDLTFILQEIFLVLPKALTPGLHPVLFHNNHDWTGDNPLAELLQGSGALAVLTISLALYAVLLRAPPTGFLARCFLTWLVFHGVFQSAPQVVVGAALPGNDVGRAMAYLGMPMAAKLAAAAVAIAFVIWFGLRMRRPFLALAHAPGGIASPRARTAFVWRTLTLPLFISLPVIFLSRVPGSWDQVYLVPVAVAIIGSSWVQAGAWAEGRASAECPAPVRSLVAPVIALAVLLAVFHLVLRPGVAFG